MRLHEFINDDDHELIKELATKIKNGVIDEKSISEYLYKILTINLQNKNSYLANFTNLNQHREKYLEFLEKIEEFAKIKNWKVKSENPIWFQVNKPFNGNKNTSNFKRYITFELKSLWSGLQHLGKFLVCLDKKKYQGQCLF